MPGVPDFYGKIGKRETLLLVLVITSAATAFTLLENGSRGTPDEPIAALRCGQQDRPCTQIRVERRPTGCSEWYPHMAEEKLSCNYTTQGRRDISYITDPANYLLTPFTEKEFSVEKRPLGLSSTYDLEFLPHGDMLVTEKKGNLYRIDEEKHVIADVPSTSYNETVGLMGLAVDPNFSTNHYIYLYYTTGILTYPRINKEGITTFVKSRIVRFKLRGTRLLNRTVLLRDIPGSIYHAGGRLEFGPDGKLYATTGDGGLPRYVQNPRRLHGKILRMNPNGSVPVSNPFNDSYVYARAFKNPQGLAWHPVTGDLYATEHGNWRHDEINHIVPGANYGWGPYTCTDSTGFNIPLMGNYTKPVLCWEQFTLAPSSATFVAKKGHPWYGSLFVTTLRGQHLRRITRIRSDSPNNEIFWVNKANSIKSGISRRLRDVEFHNNSLWVLGDWGGIIRLTPEQGNASGSKLG